MRRRSSWSRSAREIHEIHFTVDDIFTTTAKQNFRDASPLCFRGFSSDTRTDDININRALLTSLFKIFHLSCGCSWGFVFFGLFFFFCLHCNFRTTSEHALFLALLHRIFHYLFSVKSRTFSSYYIFTFDSILTRRAFLCVIGSELARFSHPVPWFSLSFPFAPGC